MKKRTKEKITKTIIILITFGMAFGGLGGTAFMAFNGYLQRREQSVLAEQQAADRLAAIEAELQAVTDATASTIATDSAADATDLVTDTELSDQTLQLSDTDLSPPGPNLTNED